MSRYDLKMARAFGDFSDWTYTGNCDSKGGYCECGKQIIYRYFVNRGSETKIVGSTCIDHFKGNSVLYSALKEADKVNKRNHKERQTNIELIHKYLNKFKAGKTSGYYSSYCQKYLDDEKQIRFDFARYIQIEVDK